MKRLFTYLTALSLPLLLFSCQEKQETFPQARFYPTVTGSDKVIELLAGKSRTIDLHVCAEQVSNVCNTMTFKVDPEAVAAYNSANGTSCGMLPSSSFEFTRNEVMLPDFNKESTTGKIRITATGLEDNVLYLLPIAIDKVSGTSDWTLTENPVAYIRVMQVNVGPEGGDGSMEYPYELRTPEDMKAMKEKLSSEEKVYFRMMNDIDMSSIDDWEPLNYASPYDKAIDFDGAGHTIDNFHITDWGTYASFFGALYGYCHDVTFTNALVECGADSGCGILGGYGGTGDKHADVARVHLHGKVNFTGNKTGVGGMFGCAGNATIEGCSADVEVTSPKNYVGGLVGYSKKVLISNCWVSGSVRGDQRVGGIAGGINGVGDAIINCYAVNKLYIIKEDGTKEYAATRSVGGIVAHANNDKNANNETLELDNTVSGCIAWQDEIKTRTYLGAGVAIDPKGDQDWYSSGAIVAYGATRNTYENCYRKASLDFRDYADALALYDQDNSSPSNPLVIHTKIEGNTHNYPYHGKAAPAGSTLSQVAQSLGWDASVWNFSGEFPTIRPDAPVGPIPDVTGDGRLPGFDNNDLN